MRSFRRSVSIGRGMVVIAAFALALAIAPASHRYLALLPLGVGLPAMYLRSRGEFLAVMSIVSILVALLAPALMVARAGAHVRPLPQVKVRYFALTAVNYSWCGWSGVRRCGTPVRWEWRSASSPGARPAPSSLSNGAAIGRERGYVLRGRPSN
jgi:hypothetical protein